MNDVLEVALVLLFYLIICPVLIILILGYIFIKIVEYIALNTKIADFINVFIENHPAVAVCVMIIMIVILMIIMFLVLIEKFN